VALPALISGFLAQSVIRRGATATLTSATSGVWRKVAPTGPLASVAAPVVAAAPEGAAEGVAPRESAVVKRSAGGR
jgi:hypothetical protein